LVSFFTFCFLFFFFFFTGRCGELSSDFLSCREPPKKQSVAWRFSVPHVAFLFFALIPDWRVERSRENNG
jgi:hypothetical protein